MRNLGSVIHANINIKGGNIFQNEIYKVIRDARASDGTNRHLSVLQEHKIPLIERTQETNRRKYHKVDIFIIDETTVTAINSKGKSFNNTMSEDSALHEYNWYLDSIKALYPQKECRYWIFKDEYNPSDSRMGVYRYLNANGIFVYNTEQYLVEHYGCDFTTLEHNRQERAVAECETGMRNNGYNPDLLYQLTNNS